MKTTLLATLALFPMTALLAQLPAFEPPLVSTSGSAEIRVVPDRADLVFEVETRSLDLPAARKDQTARATKVLTALRAAGILEADLQSSQVYIVPDYTNQREETDRVRFYRVSQTITATVNDVKKVPDLTEAAVVAGATGVHTATLRTSQLRKFRDEARSKAIRAAREKAVALASELGAKVARPYRISEGYPVDLNSNFNATIGADPAPDEPLPDFAPGSISITANVNVSFLLE